MKQFTKTDVTRKFSEVGRAAYKGPVVITENGKKRYVILSIEDYESLIEELHSLKIASSEGAGTPAPD